MNNIKGIRVHVSKNNGESLLCETHLIAFGPGGLLKLPQRLGFAADDLLCFPTEEDSKNIENQGAPLSSVCETFKLGCVPSISAMLLSAGFLISEDLIADVWIRCEPPRNLPLHNLTVSSISPVLPNEACSSGASRNHLPPRVRRRMKELCNEVCPRDGEGVMLGERSVSGEKRPAWCIEKIVHDLEEEFDEKHLNDIRERATSFIARNALLSKRVNNLTDRDWANMNASDKMKMEAIKLENELCYERWKKGPYGCCWLTQGLRRQPTAEELNVIFQRRFDAKTTVVPTTQYVLFPHAYEIIMPLLFAATKYVDSYITYIAN